MMEDNYQKKIDSRKLRLYHNAAVRIIANLTYKPGWEFKLRGKGRDKCVAVISSFSDNSETWMQGAPVTVKLDIKFLVLPMPTNAQAARDELLARIYDLVLGIEGHEIREHFKIGKEHYRAPHIGVGSFLWDNPDISHIMRVTNAGG
jgi:hypothetical protein